MALISRDPFARTELHRETVKVSWPHPGCKFCGSFGASNRLYKYRTESDGGRKYEHPGEFCSIACFRAYSC